MAVESKIQNRQSKIQTAYCHPCGKETEVTVNKGEGEKRCGVCAKIYWESMAHVPKGHGHIGKKSQDAYRAVVTANDKAAPGKKYRSVEEFDH